MLFPIFLQAAIQSWDPEIEAVLRRRDAARREAALAPVQAAPSQADDDDLGRLIAAVPPLVAGRFAACLSKTNTSPADGLRDALAWVTTGGGAYAALCHGYALGKAERWAEAQTVLATGAAMPGLSEAFRAQLHAQAGNAALLAGDSKAAAAQFDAALGAPLPKTLATGEIHLDRARARVANGDLAGARADLDSAIALAAADPLTWLLSATLARRTGNLALARDHIAQAARRAPRDGQVALEQGVILALSGDQDGAARAAFLRARELAGAGLVAQQAEAYLAQLGPEPTKTEGR
jgi:hypothetical protein